MEHELFLPTLSHWEHGNPWTGSFGPRARFYIVPQEGQISIQMWEGPLCRTLAQLEEPVQFPISEEGLGPFCWSSAPGSTGRGRHEL